MKLKELSLTDLIAFFSAISITVTFTSQTYFYYRLDSLWLMAVITPSSYILEVIKVFLILFVLLIYILILKAFYDYSFKKKLTKKKVKLTSNNSLKIREILLKDRKKYESYLTIWVCIFTGGIVFTLLFFRVIDSSKSLIIPLLIGACVGGVLSLIFSKNLDKSIKFSIWGIVIILVSLLNAEFKYNQLNRLETVYLTDEKSDFNKAKLVEISSDKAILLKRDIKTNIEIKIVPIDDIEKIVVEKRSN